MKERPIVFSGPLVRAILAGQKTQTRRIVKDADDHIIFWRRGEDDPKRWVACDGLPIGYVYCPYGEPGDRLWVRETWKCGEYSCDDEPQEDDHECSAHCQQTYVYYKATPRVGYRPVPDRARIVYLDDSTPLTPFYEGGWKPSIHMPRCASRITLEVTGVRVERLQEINANDALAEGVGLTPFWKPKELEGAPFEDKWWDDHHFWSHYPQLVFQRLWDSINAKRAPWKSNPWVWVVEFRRLEWK